MSGATTSTASRTGLLSTSPTCARSSKPKTAPRPSRPSTAWATAWSGRDDRSGREAGGSALRRAAMLERARLRLTAWYVSLLAMLLIVFDLGVLSIMNQGLQTDLADDLHRKASQASAAIVEIGGSTYFDRNQLASDPGWADVSLFASTTSGTVSANLLAGSVLPDRTALDRAMSGRPGLTTIGHGRNRF